MKVGDRVKFWHYGKEFEGIVASIFESPFHGTMVSFEGESLVTPHPSMWDKYGGWERMTR